MSHYTVAVITKDGNYEKALAPFSEHNEVAPYIYKTKAEIIKELRDDYIKAKKNADDGYSSWFNHLNTIYDFSADDESLFQVYKKRYEDDGTLFDENDNQLSTYNPQSKWDWYVVGGRWDCEVMRLKTGEYVNEAQAKDVNFSPEELPEDVMKRVHRFWQVNVEGDELRDGEDKNDYLTFYKPEYLKERYGSVENYIKEMAEFSVHSILLHGMWIEAGEVGWFGTDTATVLDERAYRKKLAEIIQNLDPDDYITIVDCHI